MRRFRTLGGTVASVALTFCASCGGGGDAPITVVSADGNASVTASTGSFAAGVVLSVPVPTVLPISDPNLIQGTIYNFGPNGTIFNPPAILAIKFPSTKLPAVQSKTLVQIATVVGQVWAPVGGTTLLVDGATGPVSHFTPYAVLAQAFAGTYHLDSLGDGSQTVNCPGSIDFGSGLTDVCTGTTMLVFGPTGSFSSGSSGHIISSGTWSMDGDTLTIDTTARNGSPAATDTYRAARTASTMTLTRLSSTDPAKKVGEIYNCSY